MTITERTSSEDWVKNSWDLPPSFEGLCCALGVPLSNPAKDDERIKEMVHLQTLPSYKACPFDLRQDIDQYLHAEGMVQKAFDPDEKRDGSGKWTRDGDDTETIATPEDELTKPNTWDGRPNRLGTDLAPGAEDTDTVRSYEGRQIPDKGDVVKVYRDLSGAPKSRFDPESSWSIKSMSVSGKERTRVQAHALTVHIKNAVPWYDLAARDKAQQESIRLGREQRAPFAYAKGPLSSYLPDSHTGYRRVSFLPSAGRFFMVDDHTEWLGADDCLLDHGDMLVKGNVKTGEIVDLPLTVKEKANLETWDGEDWKNAPAGTGDGPFPSQVRDEGKKIYSVNPQELPKVAGWEMKISEAPKPKEYAKSLGIDYSRLSSLQKEMMKNTCPRFDPPAYSSTINGTTFEVTFQGGLDPSDRHVTPEKITALLTELTSLANKHPLSDAAWANGGDRTVRISVGRNPLRKDTIKGFTLRSEGRMVITNKAFGDDAEKPVAIAVRQGWIPASIQSKGANGPTVLEYTVAHEYGHLLDVKSDDDAKDLWRDPDVKAISDYAAKRPREAMAEAWAELYFAPGQMSVGAKKVARSHGWMA